MKIKLTQKQKESRKMCKIIMKITWKICRHFDMALKTVWRSYSAKQLDLFA